MNSIYLNREYYQDFACEFDLLYYPFDTQMCRMILAINGFTSDYMKIVQEGVGVEFTGMFL